MCRIRATAVAFAESGKRRFVERARGVMVALALRRRPADAFSGLFWLSVFLAALMPTSIGYQDLAAFFAQKWEPLGMAIQIGLADVQSFRCLSHIEIAVGRKFRGRRKPGKRGDAHNFQFAQEFGELVRDQGSGQQDRGV